MFKMLHLSIELKSTGKSYTFPFSFTDTSIESLAPNLLDMLPKKMSWKVNIIDFFSICK